MAKKKTEAAQPSAAYNVFEEFGEGGKQLIRPATIGREVNILPTGILALDLATGTGGIKGGTISTITGDSNAGKSTTCYRIAANAQERGMKIIIWDTENRYQPDIAAANGLDLQEYLPENERSVGILQWSPYETNEEVARATLQNVQYAVRKFFTEDTQVLEYGGLFIIDSLNFIMPAQQEQGVDNADEDKGAGEGGGIALIPRMLASWMPELLGLIHRPKNYLVATRQFRAKIGTMTRGDAINFSGGNAILYGASLDVVYKYIGKEPVTDAQKKQGWERSGNNIQITVRKNTAGVFGRQTQFEMSVEHGPDDIESIIRYGQMFNCVKKAGAYYSLLLPDGTWTQNMYEKDMADYFWQDEEHLQQMFDIMENIRQASLRVPKRRTIGGNNVGNSSASEE